MKKLGKYICALLCMALLLLSLAGCTATCKEKGCNADAYNNGYCEVHYILHQAEGLLGGLFD